MFDQQLFELVRCPVTKSRLVEASDELIASVNEVISRGKLRNRLDLKIEQPIEAGLLNADGSLLFPAVGGIPSLIPDEAIPLENGQVCASQLE